MAPEEIQSIANDIDDEIEELTDEIGPVHVSYKRTDNVVPEKQYRLIFKDYKFMRSAQKKTLGVDATFAFDATRYPEYEKRTLHNRFWVTPGSMWQVQNFLVCAKMNPELFREEPVLDEAGNEQRDDNNRVVTRCVYSLKDQLDSVIAAPVFADVVNEEYEATAADGVTKEMRKHSVIARFVKE